MQCAEWYSTSDEMWPGILGRNNAIAKDHVANNKNDATEVMPQQEVTSCLGFLKS